MVEYVVQYDNEVDGKFYELTKDDIPLFGVHPYKIISGKTAIYRFHTSHTLEEICEELDNNSNWCYAAIKQIA